MKCVVVFDFLLFLHFIMYLVYGCEDFTHPLGREENSWVKGLVELDNLVEKLGVWTPLYAIIIHIFIGGDLRSMLEMRKFMEYGLQGSYS